MPRSVESVFAQKQTDDKILCPIKSLSPRSPVSCVCSVRDSKAVKEEEEEDVVEDRCCKTLRTISSAKPVLLS